jgi:hypothetical protein
MKGLLFIVVVTILVLASFARPESEGSSYSSISRTNQPVAVQDTSNLAHK